MHRKLPTSSEENLWRSQPEIIVQKRDHREDWRNRVPSSTLPRFLIKDFFSVCDFFLTRPLRIWKLDRVRVHRGVRKSWGFKGNTRVQGKRLYHELLPRCRDRKDHWKSLQQTHLPNYDCRYHFYSSGMASSGSKTSNKIQELRPVVWWSWFSWFASQ